MAPKIRNSLIIFSFLLLMSSPGIIINDELFAMGGTTEKELRDKLEKLKE